MKVQIESLKFNPRLMINIPVDYGNILFKNIRIDLKQDLKEKNKINKDKGSFKN